MIPPKGIEKYYKWFSDFTEKFYSDDEEKNKKIRSRIEHSIEVVKNILSIQNSEVENIPRHIKEIAALLHDVGRFHQILYQDVSSGKHPEDHAELGVNLLREKLVLDDLPERDRELILNSIFFHNKKGLHLKSNDTEMIYITDLLRTADKMDIVKKDNKNCSL